MKHDPQTISQILEKVSFGYWIISGVSLFMFVGIITFVIFCLVKYRRSVHKTPAQIEGNLLLELTWTLIPTVIVMGFFFQGWDTFNAMRDVPDDAMEITVYGRMWSWSYEYPNGYQTDILVLPQNRPVKLNLSSEDVIHSFYIPAFRTKEDVVPGLPTYLSFTADKTGEFDVFCAEFCGRLHSQMLSKIRVVPEEEWNEFVKNSDAEIAALAGDDIESRMKRAQSLIKRKGCVTCHSLDGTPRVGPSFKDVFGTKRIIERGGTETEILVDESYLKKAIQDPKSEIVKGYDPLMPKVDLSDNEIDLIVELIKKGI